MRICSVFEYPTLNGGERSWLAMLPAMRAAGWEVCAVVPPQGALSEALDAAHVPQVHWRQECGGPRLTLDQRRADLARCLREVRCTVAHANSLSVSRVMGPVSRELALPGVGHLRDIVRVSRQAMRDINQNARLIAVSRATFDWHVARGLDDRRTVVVHNGVDLQTFRAAETHGSPRATCGLPDDAKILGAVGQLGMRKGLDVLLEALSMVVRCEPRAVLMIVGERNSEKAEAIAFEQALHQRAREDDLRGHVLFLGRRTDVPELMRNWDLLVHAARQEPLGRVLLESLASGLPLVATDVGGTREILRGPQDGGVLVAPERADLLANAILSLLHDADQRSVMSRRARWNAERRFDAAQAGAQFVARVRELVA